ncbi:MAG: TRAM domain-containing protein [Thermoplasmata archaeon]|nr:MAG: TRAM domain-containing protein [Thermoplasmata archaeon]
MQYDGYSAGPGRSPPVKEGETYQVKIESIGREGDGIAKIEGFVVFIPGVQVGDELDVKINKVTRRVAFGEKVGSSVSGAAMEAPSVEPSTEDEHETEVIEHPDDTEPTEE